MPENTFAERLKKARLLANLSQFELSKLSCLSRSTINDLECNYRDELTLDTLNKLLNILDKNVLCDEYCLFILNQKENIDNLMNKYSVNEICKNLNIQKSTLYRWKNTEYQVKRKYFLQIKNMLKARA